MNFAILCLGNCNIFTVLQTIPYVGQIAGGIRPGTRLHVQGTVHPNAKEYVIIYLLKEKHTKAYPFFNNKE